MKVDIYNTDKKYKIIYADPPWKYNDVHTWHKMGGGVAGHYKTMNTTEIKNMSKTCVRKDKRGISNGINNEFEANENLICEDLEVIGNKWDNPELLEEGE